MEEIVSERFLFDALRIVDQNFKVSAVCKLRSGIAFILLNEVFTR